MWTLTKALTGIRPEGTNPSFDLKMNNWITTFLLLCQIFISNPKPVSRRTRGKQISADNISEPEAALQMRHDYLENKINTLVLESILIDSLLENQNSNLKLQSPRRRKLQLRRQSSRELDVHSELYMSKLLRRQYRRRGNRGDLVPFPRVG